MANAIISTDSDVADIIPMSPEQNILKKLDTDFETRSKGAYSTKQIITSTVPYKFNLVSVSTPEAGGAIVPTSPAAQIGASFAPINPAVRKLSNVNTIQYVYDLNYYTGFLGSTYPPTTDFTVPVYLTIGVARFNYFRDLVGTKYSAINSFQVGNLSWQNSAPVSFYLQGNSGTETVRDRVDWTVPINDRSIISTTSGVIVRDFTQDQDKITQDEKQQILDGTITTLFIVFAVDTSGLATNEQNFMLFDVAPNFTFYGSLSFDFFGLGAAYTPII